MTKIVSILDQEPHKVSEVVCVKCHFRWIATRPDGTRLRDMECPGCGEQGGVIETGEIIDEEE